MIPVSLTDRLEILQVTYTTSPLHNLAIIVSGDCTEDCNRELSIFSLRLEKMPLETIAKIASPFESTCSLSTFVPYFPSKRPLLNQGEDMGYRKVDKGISFAEGALLRSLEHNCSGEMMERINTVVGWENRAALLREYYPTGQSYEGADRYPPLMVVNGMVLQKWFPIPSDPEPANQIKDRISFKKFPGLPCDKPSPDHAPFSRFRSGLSREAMIAINHELLLQFAHKGLTINEGGAIAVLTNVKPRAMFDALKGMRK